MTSVELVNPATDSPFRSFEHNTTRMVALPEGADWELYVQVDQPGELKVESQGRSICTRPIDPTIRLLPLAELLSGKAERRWFMVLRGVADRTVDRQLPYRIQPVRSAIDWVVCGDNRVRILPPTWLQILPRPLFPRGWRSQILS